LDNSLKASMQSSTSWLKTIWIMYCTFRKRGQVKRSVLLIHNMFYSLKMRKQEALLFFVLFYMGRR
jgi:hypothetical protein